MNDSLPVLAPQRKVDWSGCSWRWLDEPSDAQNSYADFFLDFTLEEDADEAWLGMTADANFQCWLNGEWLLAGPMREAPPFFYYDVLDLRSRLRIGANHLRVRAHRVGVGTTSHQPAEGGVMMQGSIRTRGGAVLDLGENAGWRVRRSPGYRSPTHRLTVCLGFSEHYDFRTSDEAWLNRPTPPDCSLASVRATFPHGKLKQPLERNYPEMRSQTWHASPLETSSGASLFGFPQIVFGFVTLTFRVREEITFSVLYGEELEDGRVNAQKGGFDYRDQISAPPGEHTWRSYSERCMHYLEVPGEVEIVALSVQEYLYPYERVYRAESGPHQALDQRILDVSARTIEISSNDLLNDPWRERGQYADVWAYMPAMLKLFGTLEPARKYVYQMLRPVESRGRVPMCYPSEERTIDIPDYTFTAVLMLERYHRLTGDTAVVEAGYEAGVRAMHLFDDCARPDGLLQNLPGWVFIDNTFELNKHPVSSALNAIYAGGYRALANLARVLGKSEEAALHDAKFQQLRLAWRDAFLQSDTILDGVTSPQFASRHYWNYHRSSDTNQWQDRVACFLKVRIRAARPGPTTLFVSCFAGCRLWMVRTFVFEGTHEMPWRRPPLFQPMEVPFDATGDWQELWIELQFAWLDWEVYLGTAEPLEVDGLTVCDLPSYGAIPESTLASLPGQPTAFRPYVVPRISQITVGFATFYGMLNSDEAKPLLRKCLPETYYMPWAKRTTPIFVEIDSDIDRLKTAVMPCNTPASLFVFCEALRQEGMSEEAKAIIRKVYGALLDRGATCWWEEWNNRSSLSHAWGSFAADFLI